MNRREFMQRTALAAGAVAALRAGNLSAAGAALADAKKSTGLKHTLYNVREFGVKGDGITDDLPAILDLYQRAKRDLGGHPSVTYFFPAGRYLLSDALRAKYNQGNGDPFTANYICQYIGQGPMLSQLVLKPGAEGFQDPEKPKLFTLDGTGCGETLGQIFDSLAIIASENGSNPGSIGSEWTGHFGVSRNLYIAAGHTCLNVMRCGVGGLHVYENLTCVGGRTGIYVQGGMSMHSVCCLGFSECGVRVGPPQPGSLHNLYTRGSGPGLFIGYNHMSISGARLEADPPGQDVAIVKLGGGLTCSMVETVGYRQMVSDMNANQYLAAATAPLSALSFYTNGKHAIPPRINA